MHQAERRSCGSAARSTSPASSSRASTRVTVGRWTCSRSASSDGVSGPWRSIVASAAVWEGRARRPPPGAGAAPCGRCPAAAVRRGRTGEWYAPLTSLANYSGAGSLDAPCARLPPAPRRLRAGRLRGQGPPAAGPAGGEADDRGAEGHPTVREDTVELRGRVSPARASVQVHGEAAAVTTGAFATSVALEEGVNVIDVWASMPGRARRSRPCGSPTTRASPSRTSPASWTTRRPTGWPRSGWTRAGSPSAACSTSSAPGRGGVRERASAGHARRPRHEVMLRWRRAASSARAAIRATLRRPRSRLTPSTICPPVASRRRGAARSARRAAGAPAGDVEVRELVAGDLVAAELAAVGVQHGGAAPLGVAGEDALDVAREHPGELASVLGGDRARERVGRVADLAAGELHARAGGSGPPRTIIAAATPAGARRRRAARARRAAAPRRGGA